MKLQRTKNAGRNIVFGFLLKIFQILVPFALRTAMIYSLGIEYIGLNSLFSSILQVLNLAELGVGSAMIFSMYAPIAEDNETEICALMKLYRKYYRIIGTVILIAGLSILPFLPLLIKGDVPGDLNLYVLYLLHLSTTVLTYWLFAYKNSIISAHQRIDVTSKIGITMSAIEYFFQFIALIKLRNYYCFLLIKLLSQISQNIITAYYSDKMYPQYKPKGELSLAKVHEINKKVKDLFTAKIGAVIVNSVDSLVISAFLGLAVLAIYNNYYYILTSVMGFIGIIFSSCTAGIGNSLQTETKEKNYYDFCVFTFIIIWIAGICTCCLLCLYQPFMLFWLENPNLCLGNTEVICFCIYFFIYEVASLLFQYKDAAGIWHEDRFRPLITALTNLFLNVTTVKYLGVVGVLMSTALSFLVIGIPWLIHNVFKLIFMCSPNTYIKKLVCYCSVVFLACCSCYFLCNFILVGGLIGLFLKAFVCFLTSNIIFYMCFRKSDEYKSGYNYLMRILKRT